MIHTDSLLTPECRERLLDFINEAYDFEAAQTPLEEVVLNALDDGLNHHFFVIPAHRSKTGNAEAFEFNNGDLLV